MPIDTSILAVGAKRKSPDLLSKYYWPILILIGGVLLVAGYFILVDGQVSHLRAALASDKISNDQVAAAKAKLAGLNSQYDSRIKLDGRQTGLLNTALPDSVDYPSIILQYSVMAQRAGMFPTSVDIAESAGGAPTVGGAALPPAVGLITVSLKLSDCTYDNLKKMSGLLEQSAMVSSLSSVAFSPNSNIASNNCDIKISAYYYKK